MGLHQLKNFCKAQKTIHRVKKISVSYSSDMGLISSTYEEIKDGVCMAKLIAYLTTMRP
jgi:hypothetical protein